MQGCSHGVTVSTLDSESSDGGSNPPGSFSSAEQKTSFHKTLTAVGFEPPPLRTNAVAQRLRPLGQTVPQAQMH